MGHFPFTRPSFTHLGIAGFFSLGISSNKAFKNLPLLALKRNVKPDAVNPGKACDKTLVTQKNK